MQRSSEEGDDSEIVTTGPGLGPIPVPATNRRNYLRTQISKQDGGPDIIYQVLSPVGRIRIDGPFTGAIHSEAFLKTLEYKTNGQQMAMERGNT